MKSDPEAMIFDLDGVITFTAQVHAAAWKQLFDEFLKERSAALHEPYREFTIAECKRFLSANGIPVRPAAP